MIYNYERGVSEVLTLVSIGSNSGVDTVIKADGVFTNVVGSGLVLYTDSAGTSQVPTSAYPQTNSSTLDGITIYKTYNVSNALYQGVPLYATFTNYGVYTDMGVVADAYNAGTISQVALTPGRTAIQELTSDTLTTSGWYTIAETETIVNSTFSGEFDVSYSVEILGCRASISNRAYVKNTQNTTIELIGGANDAGTKTYIKGFRIAKSDSSSTSGAKLQVNIFTVGTNPMVVSLYKGTGRNVSKSWELVTPYLDDTPILPDGVTTGTFLEAGAEFVIGSGQSGSFCYSSIIGWKEAGDDQVRCSVIWPEIPKQGTGLTITFPSVFRFKDILGNQSAQPVTPYISSVQMKGKEVTFIIEEAGIATGLELASPLFVRLNGALTLTITD